MFHDYLVNRGKTITDKALAELLARAANTTTNPDVVLEIVNVLRDLVADLCWEKDNTRTPYIRSSHGNTSGPELVEWYCEGEHNYPYKIVIEYGPIGQRKRHAFLLFPFGVG